MPTRSDQPTVRQLVLPGQAAAADGPVDMYAMYLMHHAFRRDLARFAAAVARTPAEDRATWARLRARWDVLAGALHDHHESEDARIWPFVVERADDDGRSVLLDMEAEHAQIDPLLDACRTGLLTMEHGGTVADRAAVEADLVAARGVLHQHLAHEETDAIPVIQRSLTAEDWRTLERQLQKGGRLSAALTIVPWALHEVPRAAREHAFGGPGGLVFRLLWIATRGRWARRERRTFRYA